MKGKLTHSQSKGGNEASGYGGWKDDSVIKMHVVLAEGRSSVPGKAKYAYT